MTNLFSDFDAEIYSISMRDQIPQNDIAIKNYAVSESQIIRSIFKGTETGAILEKKNYDSVNSDSANIGMEKSIYSFAKKFRRYIFFYIRELIWKTGKWKIEKLDKYIDEVSPDVIFMPVFNCIYPYTILQYIHERTNAKVILFHSDDNYSLRQWSFNPLFWIYRFQLRCYIKKAVDISSVNYTISSVQKEEYEKLLKREFKFLTKFENFNEEPILKQSHTYPLQFVYTGNLELNRWKSLTSIANSMKKVNENGVKVQLRIYSSTAITKRMKKALNIPDTSFLMGSIPASEIESIQSNADALVHVEATDIKNRTIVHQSFSTKLVDYMKRARAIFAFGPKDVASISHLQENDAALTVTSEKEIVGALNRIVENPSLLNEYALKGYECGRRFHNKDTMKKMLVEDMQN